MRTNRVVVVGPSRDEACRYALREGLRLEPAVGCRWAICVATRSDVDRIGSGWLTKEEVAWVSPSRINPLVAALVRLRIKG